MSYVVFITTLFIFPCPSLDLSQLTRFSAIQKKKQIRALNLRPTTEIRVDYPPASAENKEEALTACKNVMVCCDCVEIVLWLPIIGIDCLRPFALQKMTSLQSAWNSLMQDAVHSSSCAALLSRGIPGISNGSRGIPNSSTAWCWSSSGLTM